MIIEENQICEKKFKKPVNVSEARLSITHRIEKTFLLSFFFKQSDGKCYVLSYPVTLSLQHLACGPSSSCTILPCVFICLFFLTGIESLKFSFPMGFDAKKKAPQKISNF